MTNTSAALKFNSLQVKYNNEKGSTCQQNETEDTSKHTFSLVAAKTHTCRHDGHAFPPSSKTKLPWSPLARRPPSKLLRTLPSLSPEPTLHSRPPFASEGDVIVAVLIGGVIVAVSVDVGTTVSIGGVTSEASIGIFFADISSGAGASEVSASTLSAVTRRNACSRRGWKLSSPLESASSKVSTTAFCRLNSTWSVCQF